MKWIQRATDSAYRRAIADERNQGRLPLALFTWGEVSGRGWGFLGPWAQIALFAEKGTLAGGGSPRRRHEPFWLLRLRPLWRGFRHPNHDYVIEGRYWSGLAWRRSWGWRGRWIRRPAWRKALLDPDRITHDPGKADDWGSLPGEDW